MRKLVVSYARNVIRSMAGSVWFEPMLATLYPTPMCNLRCDYCHDFGAHRNAEFRGQELSFDKMARVIDMLAADCHVLYFTGGEPTLREDLVDLARRARKAGIRYLAMNTNALLLRDRADLLSELDNVVISLDSLEVGRRDSALAGRPKEIAKLLDGVRWAAAEQKARGFTLTVTAVVSPGMVADARKVRDFCFEIGAQFSAQHLNVERLPSPELHRDPEFRGFIHELIADKRAGRDVSGSELYLGGVCDLSPYRCTPTAAPHVDWMGRLAYPCRERPDHIWVDMLRAGSYRAALAEAARLHGPPPGDCHRCGARCYLEISLLVRHPGALARETIGYVARQVSRRGMRVLYP